MMKIKFCKKNIKNYRVREVETDLNSLNQFGRGNDIVFTVIPETIKG